jgi:PEP-CTERM motif-containing protein
VTAPKLLVFALMRRTPLGLAILVLGFLGVVCPAEALTIDFTSKIWSGAEGKTSFTAQVGGVDITVTSLLGKLTFNANDVDPLCSTTGLACSGDGLGVTDDEVTALTELLSVSFSAPVSVTGLAFLDLFGFPNKSGDPAAETAMWAVAPSGQIASVTGTDTSTTLGYRAVLTNYTNVTALHFFAALPVNSDFSLAAISIKRDVPEPATLLLSGLGLAYCSMKARRRRRD